MIDGLRPYRCQNGRCSADPHGRAIYDFWAAEPVCPKCGCDGRRPRTAHVVIPLVVLHFVPPLEKVEGMGTGYLACDPSVRVGAGNTRATGDPTVVTCPGCKQTDAFKAALDSWGYKLVDAGDYMVLIDPGAGTLVRKDKSAKEVAERRVREEGCCGAS